MAQIKETYPVSGIGCTSCISKIETVLSKTEGITSSNVNFASEKVTIEYDDEKTIKDIGYELTT